ncbi:unnamed protein product [Cyprideis torosa]|uniref:Uncharacterized protein n=1 Tax=Cyprideis torosa TaxID=163714 RepID=A0A7R8ZKJ5_9CRUS|nr:unnamed protein product [Cyprideis torosa]CAG0889527.1 unnamed protein product [Cyprideis torosa]
MEVIKYLSLTEMLLPIEKLLRCLIDLLFDKDSREQGVPPMTLAHAGVQLMTLAQADVPLMTLAQSGVLLMTIAPADVPVMTLVQAGVPVMTLAQAGDSLTCYYCTVNVPDAPEVPCDDPIEYDCTNSSKSCVSAYDEDDKKFAAGCAEDDNSTCVPFEDGQACFCKTSLCNAAERPSFSVAFILLRLILKIVAII